MRMGSGFMVFASFLGIFLAFMAGIPPSWIDQESFGKWPMDRAVQVLNASPWARHETFTQVISGVGSGISGEKEIFNTYYVRFLSARPIREAYARIQQIQHGYDKMSPEKKRAFEEAQLPNLDWDVSRWIVVSVGFRSNDPNEESNVRRFFQSETVQTLKTKAFLSTPTCPQVELSAYFPQHEESVGAKFVFPRKVNGISVLNKESSNITFELVDVPGTNPRLRATFAVKPMIVGDQLIF
jgi:hypothetical protein